MQIDLITSASNGADSLTALKTDIGALNAADLVVDDKISAKTHIVVSPSAYADYITDGVEDDVQLNAAIVAVNAAGGGTVEIKKGTYAIKNRVNILSNVRILAHGATFVGRNGGDVDDQMMFLIYNAVNVSVYGGIYTYDGSSPTNTLPTSGNIVASYHGIYVVGATNLRIKDCYFNGVYGGITIDASETVIVANCNFRVCLAGVAFIASSGSSQNIVVADNVFKDGYDDAVAVIVQNALYSATNVTVVGNVFDHLAQTVDSGRAVYIAGISGNLARYVSVTGNTIQNFQLEGIWITNYSDNCVITGNVINNTCRSITGTRYAIQVDSGATGILVANNIIANQTYPIRIGGSNSNLCGPNLKYNVGNPDSIAAGNLTVIPTST